MRVSRRRKGSGQSRRILSSNRKGAGDAGSFVIWDARGDYQRISWTMDGNRLPTGLVKIQRFSGHSLPPPDGQAETESEFRARDLGDRFGDSNERG